MKNPIEYMPAFEDALDEYIRQEHPQFLTPKMNVAVGFTGSFGFHRVSPRELLSGYLATLVQVDGLVTKTTLAPLENFYGFLRDVNWVPKKSRDARGLRL